jgi:uncharacterized protein (TIGR02145 family)
MNRKSILILLLFITTLFFNCEKKIWENPYDTQAPKELFTPNNFVAKQVGNKINLTWAQTNNNISNYNLERKVDNASFIKVATVTAGLLSYVDNAQANGKVHEYRLTAIAGENYSNSAITSITPIGAPNIISTNINSKTFSTINFTSTVSDEGSAITSKGVCWSTNSNPTTANSKTSDGLGNSSFNSIISNLNSNVKYFFRPYAINAVGTSYGPEQSITLVLNTPGPTATDGSGNNYNSVQIGDQTWLSKNLITTKYQNGQSIPLVTDSKAWTNSNFGAYCNFNNDINIGNIYGHLYNFYSVVDSRNICPLGWHVPSKTEWETLLNYLGGSGPAGNKLKEKGNLYWIQENATGDNSSGFSARAGAWRSQDGGFYYGVRAGGALFWSSTKEDIKYPWVFGIQIFDATGAAKIVKDAYFEQAAGTSIRCLKN